MKKSITSRYQSVRLAGFTVIEIILGIGMLSVFIVANFYYYKSALDVSHQTTSHIQSGFLLEEGIEAVKLLRDESWSNNIAPLTPGTHYYLSWDGTKWGTTTTSVLVEDVYERYFVLEEVKRTGNDDIDLSGGGVNDPGTRKITVTVSWNTKSGTVSTKTVETYITDLFSN